MHERVKLEDINLQKQPSRGVLRKRCSENMQRIYRKTLMLKCDFNKVTKQLYWTHTSAWVFSCKFAAYFQQNLFLEHLWRAASEFVMVSLITSLYYSLNPILTTLFSVLLSLKIKSWRLEDEELKSIKAL